jgi:hypothetical protein
MAFNEESGMEGSNTGIIATTRSQVFGGSLIPDLRIACASSFTNSDALIA